MIRIGEKLNGAIPSVGAAIRARNAAEIARLARQQAEAGSDYLDVCAAVDPQEEGETLRWMIETVQDAVDTPLCLDSPSPDALVAAMRLCRRPGIVNSVSLEPGKIETLFPAIAGTQWGCVALLCDGGSVPATADARIQIFRRILAQAEAYGVAQKQLFFDPLVITLATDGAAFGIFADCCRRIRQFSPSVHITCGLSNISFGLPARRHINRAFMALAAAAGLDSPIYDTTDRELTGMLYAADALLETDEYCLDFISAYRAGTLG